MVGLGEEGFLSEAEWLEVDFEARAGAVVVGASFSLPRAHRLAIVGPSGAGKTTLLSAIGGIAKLDRGFVRLGGQPIASSRRGEAVPAWRARIGLLTQSNTLFPHLTVRANLRYSSSSRASPLLDQLVDDLELGGLLDRHPGELSGGQARRVCLARTLGSAPGLLLLDEPFAGLDPRLVRKAASVIQSAAESLGAPAVIVVHELDRAQRLGHEVAVMDSGRIRQIADPTTIVSRPADKRVARIVGYDTFILAPHGGDDSAGVVMGVHPDGVRIVDRVTGGGSPTVWARVVAAQPWGNRWEVELDVAGERLVCRLAERPPAPGEMVLIEFDSPPRFGLDGRAIEHEQVVSR